MLLSNLRVKSQLGPAAIEKLFLPLTYQGSAQTFIDRLVVSAQMRAQRRPELRAEIRPERRRNPDCRFRRRSARNQRLKPTADPADYRCRPLANLAAPDTDRASSSKTSQDRANS